MRLLPALLLTGLFAGIATAPAAPGPGPARDGGTTPADGVQDAGADALPEEGTPEDGSPESGPPAPEPPRLAAVAGPTLKGPDDVDRNGGGTAGTRVADAADRSGRAPDTVGAPCPATLARVAAPVERLAARAGLRALPPPAPLRASSR